MAPPNVATTSDFSGFLEPEEAGPIFEEAEKTSVIQGMAEKIPMGPSGVSISRFTGNVNAEWVDEGAPKPITKGALEKQVIEPKKIAAIFVESAEVVRANPGNYMNIMRRKVAEAIAMAFDEAALTGSGPFSSYIGQTNKSVSLTGGSGNTYEQLNQALTELVTADKRLTGWLFDDVAEPILNSATDANGRPLFVEAPYGDSNVAWRQGRVLGRPAYMSDHVQNGNVIGYAGDWSQIVWGQVGGLNYDVSTQTALDLDGSGNLVSLWQNNLVAVRVETEFALLVNDPASFVELTGSAS